MPLYCASSMPNRRVFTAEATLRLPSSHPMSTSETSQVRDDSASQIRIVPDSSFYKNRPATALRTPAEVRTINKKTGNIHTTSLLSPLTGCDPIAGAVCQVWGECDFSRDWDAKDGVSATAWSNAHSGSLWLDGGWRAEVYLHGFDRG